MSRFLAIILFFFTSSLSIALEKEIETLLAVGTWGRGSVEAASDWKSLVAKDPSVLPQLFDAFNRSEPLSANWIRCAAEVLVQNVVQEKTKSPFGKTELEAFLEQFVRDTNHDAVGRLFALELLETYFPENLAEITDSLLVDPCGEMRRPAITKLIDAADSVGSASEKVAILQKALPYAYDYDQVNFLAGKIAELNEKDKLGLDFDQAAARGFLVDWQVVGPFDNTDGKGFHEEYEPERLFAKDPAAIPIGPFEGKHGSIDWKPARPTDPLAMLQFNELCGKEKNVCAYALAEIDSKAARSVTFRVSSFNALKIWVNGKLLGVHEIYHGHEEPDQYVIPCELPQGKSRILVKVCQNDQSQEYTWEWRLRVRVVKEKGRRGTTNYELRITNQEKDRSHELLSSVVCPLSSTSWSSFRGSLGNPVLGTVSERLSQTLGSLDETSVLWKTPLPGKGPSSPILVGDLVVVTAASGSREKRLHLIVIDKNNGEKRWERTLLATGSLLFQEFGGIAANTPVSDGKRIVAMYSSNDVVCFDLDGNLLWTRGLGYENPRLRIDTGMSSSPVILGDRVFVQCISQGEAFFAALDLETGSDIWRIPRKREHIWSSPAICPLPNGNPLGLDAVLLVVAKEELSVVDPRTGQVPAAYRLGEFATDSNTITSPTGIDGIAYLQGSGLHKIDLSQLTNASSAEPLSLEPDWVEPKSRSDNSSPVIRGEKIYTVKPPGILVQNETETGATDWQIRLEGPFWMTPIIVGNHLIACNHGGLVQIVALPDADGEKAKVVATVQWEPRFLATPAADSDAVYFRTDGFLRKVGSR